MIVHFRKHGFSLLVTSAKYEDSSKSLIVNISAKRENNEKSKTTFFSQTFEVAENKVHLFIHFWPPNQDIDNLWF